MLFWHIICIYSVCTCWFLVWNKTLYYTFIESAHMEHDNLAIQSINSLVISSTIIRESLISASHFLKIMISPSSLTSGLNTDFWNVCTICLCVQWDPMLTTPPGLYLFSIGVLKPVCWFFHIPPSVVCDVAWLRCINIIFAVTNLYLLVALTRKIHGHSQVWPFIIVEVDSLCCGTYFNLNDILKLCYTIYSIFTYWLFF